jgi:hypothetical protein
MNFDKSEAVTLIVGSDKDELLVHADQISKNSAFFKAALKKEWLEGQTRTINLPVEEEWNVTHYLRFAYIGELPTASIEKTMLAGSHHNLEYHKLAQLYTLGKRLMDDVVQDAVIFEFIRLHGILDGAVPSHETINIIYQGTVDGDLARILLVDMYVKWATSDCLAYETDPSFLWDLAHSHLTKAGLQISHHLYRH